MKIKKILISQKQPLNLAPFTALHEKYGVDIEFRRFFLVEPLTGREFRAQRINLADYTAIVFSSRHAIDAYFKLAEEMRVKVPETMKYFCTTDVVAMYLQKHIVYRKRKIFYGTGTPQSVVDTSLFDEAGLKYNTAVLVKSVPQDLKDLDLHAYDLVVFYNPNDVKSLQVNFPEYQQEGQYFISYGRSVVKSMEEAGLSIAVKAPSPEVPSAAKAIEVCLEQHKDD